MGLFASLVAGLSDLWRLIASEPLLQVFLVSLVGNSIPYAAVPYYFVLLYISSRIGDPLQLVLIALVSAAGSALGKAFIYLLSRAFSRTVGRGGRENLELFSRLLGRWGIFLVLIATATPVPDDVILVPLAFAGYGFAAYFAASLAGKSIASLAIVFYGRGFVAALEDFGLPGYVQVPLLMGISAILMLIIYRVRWVEVLRGYERAGLRGAFEELAAGVAQSFRKRPPPRAS